MLEFVKHKHDHHVYSDGERLRLGTIEKWAGEWIFEPTTLVLFSLDANELAQLLRKVRSLNRSGIVP